MVTPEKLAAALKGLDVGNENHWTADGLPRLDTVKMLVGDQSITRDQVTAAAPGFTRASAAAAAQPQPPAVPPAPNAETPPAPPAAAASVVPAAPAAPAAPALAGLPPGADPELKEPVAINPRAAIPRADNTGEIGVLEEELAVVREELEAVEKQYQTAVALKKKLNSTADNLSLRIEKLRPVDSNQLAISDYLASEQRKRDARAGQLSKVKDFEKEHGVKLSDLVPKKAPIDAARARKPRGG